MRVMVIMESITYVRIVALENMEECIEESETNSNAVWQLRYAKWHYIFGFQTAHLIL